MTIDDLERLLTTLEQPGIDYKAAAAFDGPFRPHLASTIAAMANHPGGGTIIIGITSTNAQHTVNGLTPEDARTYDPTRVTTYLANHLDPVPTVMTSTITHPTGTVVVLQVPEFTDTPIVVIRTLQGDRLHARDGDLLIRSTACETRRVQDADELRALLGRAITKKAEGLLASIRTIVTGTPPPTPSVTPEQLHAQTLPAWHEEEARFAAEHASYARWTLKLLPQPLPPAREPTDAYHLLNTAHVSLRGWDFPHLTHGRDTQYQPGYVTDRTAWNEFHEVLHLSYQGTFAWTQVLWSDLMSTTRGQAPDAPPVIDFVGVNWSITEFFRFATTIAEQLPADALWIRLTLHDMQGRRLGSQDIRRTLWRDLVATMPRFTMEATFSTPDLQAAWKEHAITWIKEFYLAFGWPDPNPAMLHQDQDNLLQRRW